MSKGPAVLRGLPVLWCDSIAHKLTLMAHNPRHYTEMGRLVADPGKRDWDELTAEYGAMLMEGLGVMGCKRSGRGQARQRPPAPDGVPEEPPRQ